MVDQVIQVRILRSGRLLYAPSQVAVVREMATAKRQLVAHLVLRSAA